VVRGQDRTGGDRASARRRVHAAGLPDVRRARRRRGRGPPRTSSTASSTPTTKTRSWPPRRTSSPRWPGDRAPGAHQARDRDDDLDVDDDEDDDDLDALDDDDDIDLEADEEDEDDEDAEEDEEDAEDEEDDDEPEAAADDEDEDDEDADEEDEDVDVKPAAEEVPVFLAGGQGLPVLERRESRRLRPDLRRPRPRPVGHLVAAAGAADGRRHRPDPADKYELDLVVENLRGERIPSTTAC
jgi:hypothetical protein